MTPLHVLILAAGKGTRMKSARPKVLHQVAGAPMIDYVLATAGQLSPASRTVVVGHEAEQVQKALAHRADVRFVLQEPQLGTGHAVLQAKPLLEGVRGTLVLLSGDVPLLRRETLDALISTHEASGAAATVVTAIVPDPTGYGRVVRDGDSVLRIVEHRDASAAERAIREINSGIYAFDLEPLFPALGQIAADNAQREYYLPDLIGIYRTQGRQVGAVVAADPAEILGINNRSELAAMSRQVWQARNLALMAAGVTLEDPDTTYVDRDVEVGPDTTIRPGVFLQGRTRIGARCVISSGVRIVDSVLADEVTVLDHCLLTGARIAEKVSIGPFAHVRPDSDIRAGARVGNFVELKKTRLGAGSKASHLAYLGDATIGEKVNIGAGTITCNYDGVRKNPTVIEDGVFIGSDSQLIAPVRIGRDAYVAAGSTITEDVPPGALGIARGKQVNKEGWVATKKMKDEGGRTKTEG
ncbi:MAG TPA: bifunctional UDP-N-acetylglucosamine diphosphorylase/glucosamine-1-phosphate N-acetyltransferase GlmU [Vicinamibacterales bacterium]|jgi:bifunctional UDP-N-acetylglucosamine pyrophosphorylase/glucosamine-1-phosphate N-acetyltransferase